MQTTLPPNKRLRAVRLCGTVDDQISDIGKEISKVGELIQDSRGRKRDAQEAVRDFEGQLQSVKVRIIITISHIFVVLSP